MIQKQYWNIYSTITCIDCTTSAEDHTIYKNTSAKQTFSWRLRQYSYPLIQKRDIKRFFCPILGGSTQRSFPTRDERLTGHRKLCVWGEEDWLITIVRVVDIRAWAPMVACIEVVGYSLRTSVDRWRSGFDRGRNRILENIPSIVG